MIDDMDALIQKLERSVARMGDVHNESLNDSAKKQVIFIYFSHVHR